MKSLKLQVILSITLLLAACSSTYKVAEKQYETGNYVDAISTVTTSLDTSNSIPLDKAVTIINNSVTQLEKQLDQLPDNDYEGKVIAYKKLYQVKQLLSQKNYSHKFATFNTTYPMEQIKTAIAEQYYLKAKTIQPITPADYQRKINLYQQGLLYNNYKNMQTLLKESQYNYTQLTADDYYQQALNAVKAQQYQSATTYFQKAQDAYKQYGTYKDSQELLAKYDRIWRETAAQQYLLQANKIVADAQHKKDHREASEYFQKAYQSYSTYGNFKNSKELSERQQQLSLIPVYYSATNSGNSIDINYLIGHMLNKYFSSGDFRRAENDQKRDFYIKVTYTDGVKNNDRIIGVENIQENEYTRCQRTTKLLERIYTIRGSIKVDGKIHYSKSFEIATPSSLVYTYQQCNPLMPSHNKQRGENINSDGTLKSVEMLAKQASNQLEDLLKTEFRKIQQNALNNL